MACGFPGSHPTVTPTVILRSKATRRILRFRATPFTQDDENSRHRRHQPSYTRLVSDTAWDQKIDDFYANEFDESDPKTAIARMRELAGELPPGDAAALFELGGVHDSLGLEHEAIGFYRQAIAAGLEGERAERVRIQLASTLRNVGAVTEAVSILQVESPSGRDEDARQAFLALALFDEGRYGDALRTALFALIPTLDGYRSALTEYANELPSGSVTHIGPLTPPPAE